MKSLGIIAIAIILIILSQLDEPLRTAIKKTNAKQFAINDSKLIIIIDKG